jgi:hypothetical protein
MMQLPLACPECGRTETDQPVGVAVTSGVTVLLIGGLDPHNCPGCWDTISTSECGLPRVNGEPIPRPTTAQEQSSTVVR